MNFCKPESGPNVSPPPSSAPPVPPPGDPYSRPFPVSSVNLDEFSYVSSYGSDGRPTLMPRTSEDYGLSSNFLGDNRNPGLQRPPVDISNSGRVIQNSGSGDSDSSHINMRGDASLRPNTGNSNQGVDDPLGSLQEVTSTLRWITIASTCAAIVWEGFAFPIRLLASFLTKPAQPVLGAYLGFFCLLVLGAEFNNRFLMENFGFLYFPLSRGLTLLMMGSMCLGILDQWWESLLGLAFGVAGTGYIYTYIKYPEYRRWQHHNERLPTAFQEARMYWSGERKVRTAAWANANAPSLVTPQAASRAMAGFAASEAQSLLHTV